MRTAPWKAALACLPFVAWGFLVFHFSSQPYQEQTLVPLMQRHVPEQALARLLPDVTIDYHIHHLNAKREPYQFLEFVFRKTAHIILYGTLAAFAFVAMLPLRIGLVRKAAIVAALVLTIAALDETVQRTAAERTAAVHDIGIDLAGGCLGSFVAYVLWRRSERKRTTSGTKSRTSTDKR